VIVQWKAMERNMHLGQTASYLALVLNRPEPTTKMLSRLLREGDWTKKGPRGRNAPHIDSNELSSFLTAFMCCPDSPAVAMERLPHFVNLPLDTDNDTDATFGTAFSILLDRLAKETWDEVRAKNWSVSLYVDMSATTISADPYEGSDIPHEEHVFSALVHAPDDQPMKDSMPYSGGLEFSSKLRCFTLFRIAKVILAGEIDPLGEITRSLENDALGDEA
ncbi:MAG: hypothetical protein ACKVKF_02680, partial [Rhodobacterales bacterium]